MSNKQNNKVVVFLDNVVANGFFSNLVAQLNKDLYLINSGKSISENVSPSLLLNELNNIVVDLVNNDFDIFLNFLYRIDVSEFVVKDILAVNHKDYITSISYLILKRALEKVCLRDKYS